METSNYSYSDYKMYNPVTGEVIIDVECNDRAKSLIAYWIGEVFEEPVINNEGLKKAWEKAVIKHREEYEGTYPGYEVLEKFLEEYDNPDWKVLIVTSSGMACGPVSFTAWHVVDKDTVAEEVSHEE